MGSAHLGTAEALGWAALAEGAVVRTWGSWQHSLASAHPLAVTIRIPADPVHRAGGKSPHPTDTGPCPLSPLSRAW